MSRLALMLRIFFPCETYSSEELEMNTIKKNRSFLLEGGKSCMAGWCVGWDKRTLMIRKVGDPSS